VERQPGYRFTWLYRKIKGVGISLDIKTNANL